MDCPLKYIFDNMYSHIISHEYGFVKDFTKKCAIIAHFKMKRAVVS